jgi:putative transposase
MQSINQAGEAEKPKDQLACFQEVLPNHKIRALARESGAEDQRRRKLVIEMFFWLMVVGFGPGNEMKLKAIGDLFSIARLQAGETKEKAGISKEALSEQLSDRPWTFFRAVFDEIWFRMVHREEILLEEMRVFLVDATAVQVAMGLISHFPGNAAGKGKVWAGIKLHMRYGFFNHLPEIVGLTAQIRHEVSVNFLVPAGKAALYIFDLGYWKYDLFCSILERGQHFISRCKSTANPLILGIYQGQSEWIGKRLKDIRLTGKVIDLQINLSSANVSNPRLPYTLRLVGIWNGSTQSWRLYITSLCDPLAFAPGTIFELYRLRWQIEIFFRNLKHVLQIDHFLSTSENGIRIQIYAAMIFHLLTCLVMKDAAQSSRLPLVDFSFPYCAHILNLCLSYNLFGLWSDPQHTYTILLMAVSIMGLRPNRTRKPLYLIPPALS